MWRHHTPCLSSPIFRSFSCCDTWYTGWWEQQYSEWGSGFLDSFNKEKATEVNVVEGLTNFWLSSSVGATWELFSDRILLSMGHQTPGVICCPGKPAMVCCLHLVTKNWFFLRQTHCFPLRVICILRNLVSNFLKKLHQTLLYTCTVLYKNIQGMCYTFHLQLFHYCSFTREFLQRWKKIWTHLFQVLLLHLCLYCLQIINLPSQFHVLDAQCTDVGIQWRLFGDS